MTIDEYRERLKDITEDAGTIDELTTDYAEQLSNAARVEELEQEIAARDVKISELAATNLKLIDKIKYIDEEPETDDEPDEITIESLFEDDED